MSLLTPDTGLLFWMVVIFAIVFFLLAKFGFPVVTKGVEKRTQKINEALAGARAAEKKLRSVSDEQVKIIEKARAEQNRILKEAADARDEMISQAKVQAQDESAKILAQARTQISAEKESALRDIRREVATLSVGIAEKILRKEMEPDGAQLRYAEKLADAIGKGSTPAGQNKDN